MEFPDNLNDLYRRRNTHSKSFAVIAILLGTAAVMTSGWHIASIAGILGILCGLFTLGTNRQARDFAIAGLVISFIGLTLTLILTKNGFFSSSDAESTSQTSTQVSYADQQASQEGAAVSAGNGQAEATAGSLDRLDSTYADAEDTDSSTDSVYTDSSYADSTYTDSSYTDSANTDSSSVEDSSVYTADSDNAMDSSDSAAADTENGGVTTLTDAEKEEVLDKVSVYSYPTADSYFCYVATNQSDKTIPLLHLMLNFKNGSGDVISVSTADHEQVLPGQTVVSRLEAPPSYALYKSTAEIQDVPYAKVNHLKEIKTLYAEADSSIAVTATNNATVDVTDLEYILVYYQGEDIAAVSDPMDITDLPSGQSQTDSLNKPDAAYDSIKIYVNRAMADF